MIGKMTKSNILKYLFEDLKGVRVGSSMYRPMGYSSADTDIMIYAGSEEAAKDIAKILIAAEGFKEKDSPPYCDSFIRIVNNEHKIDVFFVNERSFEEIKAASMIMLTFIENTSGSKILQYMLWNKTLRVAIFELILLIISYMHSHKEESLETKRINICNMARHICWKNKILFEDKYMDELEETPEKEKGLPF